MNADSHFSIGKTHRVCEDYAMHDNYIFGDGTQFHYASVADGCSGSRDSDIGARLISKAVWDEIKGVIAKGNEDLFYSDNSGMEQALSCAASHAVNAAQCIGYGGTRLEALDCTIQGVFSVSDDEVIALSRGDGVIAVITKDNVLEIITKVYAGDMPPYLNYCNDADRESLYNAIDPIEDMEVVRLSFATGGLAPGGIESIIGHNSELLTAYFPGSGYKCVAVMSDGVSSFADPKWGTTEVVRELMSFKNTKGAFVERRLKRFLKDRAKEGVYPSDDISMAAIYMGDE